MKTLPQILPVFMVLVSISCKEPIDESPSYRVIKNESLHTIVLTVAAQPDFELILNSGDSATIAGKCYSGPGIDYCEVGWNDQEATTGKIVFDDVRELEYELSDCEQGTNFLAAIAGDPHLCGYSSRNIEGRSEYVFVVTEADFDRSRPIN